MRMRKMVCVVSAVWAAVLAFAADEEFVQVPAAEKAKDEGLLFLATFDGHNAKADFAKGSPDSFAAKDLDLGLRGLIGFDRQSAYKAVPGESLCFPAKGNFDPHQGTLILWTAANGYEPMDDKTDGKARGRLLRHGRGRRRAPCLCDDGSVGEVRPSARDVWRRRIRPRRSAVR